MKTRLFLLLLLTSNLPFRASLCAQSSFLFRNLYGNGIVDAPVFDSEGVPLAGTAYRAELWGGATSNSLAPLLVIGPELSRLIKPFATGGYVDPADPGDLVVPTVPPSGWAWLQMRAWDVGLGATYEDVAALGDGGYGESPLFYAQGHDPFREPPEIAAPLIGLQSFSLHPVPEPSAWALLALGGLAVGWTLQRGRAAPERRQGSLHWQSPRFVLFSQRPHGGVGPPTHAFE